eukprot:TRINITY_DN17979_c0_g1_i1.p1 TRINITY_DN17979_c0_g1~~TRINITY_DN17979_c0_g1_i1.p1  ORF type:complete len:195 (-),score=16.85 TRINITY_DN17979_c0_g1_i1:24-608(-)
MTLERNAEISLLTAITWITAMRLLSAIHVSKDTGSMALPAKNLPLLSQTVASTQTELLAHPANRDSKRRPLKMFATLKLSLIAVHTIPKMLPSVEGAITNPRKLATVYQRTKCIVLIPFLVMNPTLLILERNSNVQAATGLPTGLQMLLELPRRPTHSTTSTGTRSAPKEPLSRPSLPSLLLLSPSSFKMIKNL